MEDISTEVILDLNKMVWCKEHHFSVILVLNFFMREIKSIIIWRE